MHLLHKPLGHLPGAAFFVAGGQPGVMGFATAQIIEQLRDSALGRSGIGVVSRRSGKSLKRRRFRRDAAHASVQLPPFYGTLRVPEPGLYAGSSWPRPCRRRRSSCSGRPNYQTGPRFGPALKRIARFKRAGDLRIFRQTHSGQLVSGKSAVSHAGLTWRTSDRAPAIRAKTTSMARLLSTASISG